MSKLAHLATVDSTMDSFFPTVQSNDIATTESIADISDEKMLLARKRAQIATACLELMTTRSFKLNKASEHLHSLFKSQKHQYYKVALDLGKSNSVVGKATIIRWVKQYREDGLLGLVDNRKGKAKVDEGWELRAVQLFAKPQQPSFELVVSLLNKEGFDVSYGKVRRYLLSLPTDMTTFSHGRLGAKYNNLNTRKYHQLDDANIPVGHIFQGDGHECDVYVAHPNDPTIILRPELTAWIDIKSRYIPGFWLGEVENSTDTLFALSHAMTKHNHVPSLLHIDNGAGYKSHMLNEKHVGFYERFDINTMFAIPGNSKGKGRIERWFGTLESRFGKQWDSYCGKDMAAEVLRKITIETKKGNYQLPSFEEFKQALRIWIEEYNNTPHRSLDGKTPAQVWAELDRIELVTPTEAVILPVKKRVVSRTGITIDKRIYRNDELVHFQGHEVQVQYSMHNDHMVRILTLEGVWICDAKLAAKTAYIPDSRIQENLQRSLVGKQKRLDHKKAENEKRALLSLNVEPDMKSIEEFAPKAKELPETDNPITLDITDVSWADEDE